MSRKSAVGLALFGAALSGAAVVGEFIAERKILWSGFLVVVLSMVVWQRNRRRADDDPG